MCRCLVGRYHKAYHLSVENELLSRYFQKSVKFVNTRFCSTYFQNCPKLTGLAKRGGIGLCFTGLLVYRTTTCNARRLEVMITNKNKTIRIATFTRKNQQRRAKQKKGQHIKETKQDLNFHKYESSIHTRLQKLTLFNNLNISTMRLSLKPLLLI